jgi:hypothetical protein
MSSVSNSHSFHHSKVNHFFTQLSFDVVVVVDLDQVAKEENPRGGKGLPLKLSKAPVPSEILKRGRMMKVNNNSQVYMPSYIHMVSHLNI